MKKLDKDQIQHFGLVLEPSKYGFKLDRSWYGRTKNKPTLGGVPDKYLDEKKIHYNDLYFEENLPKVLLNFDLNMAHYDSLNPDEFFKLLSQVTTADYQLNGMSFVFEECFDVWEYPPNKSCVYLMVLGEYKQIYIGVSSNLPQRVRSHWVANREFDRLIFGDIRKSVLSFKSFRAFDTTQIFVIPVSNWDIAYDLENIIVDNIPSKYSANRTGGGLLEGGLGEAILKMKNRDMD